MQYTYDTAGRVMTAKDSNNKVTNFVYASATTLTGTSPNQSGYTVGDLKTVTDPSGKVTTFNSYDPTGRLLQKTDPKGIVTTYTYTPRGFLATETVTPPGGGVRVTGYSYDAVGQLTSVSNPDGTSQSFTYDAAHRLTGASDSRGNSVSYTLDNIGNRTDEQVKDPQGVLQRAISRSFDALNRLQSITGAPQ